MILIFEIPILVFIYLLFSLLKYRLIPILTFILAVSLIISIILLFTAKNKLLNFFTVIIHFMLILFLNYDKIISYIK